MIKAARTANERAIKEKPAREIHRKATIWARHSLQDAQGAGCRAHKSAAGYGVQGAGCKAQERGALNAQGEGTVRMGHT